MELALVGLGLSIVLFLAAGLQLHLEADRLKTQINIVLRALESAGIATLSRNKKGEIVGIAQLFTASGGSKSGGSITFDVVRPDEVE